MIISNGVTEETSSNKFYSKEKKLKIIVLAASILLASCCVSPPKENKQRKENNTYEKASKQGFVYVDDYLKKTGTEKSNTDTNAIKCALSTGYSLNLSNRKYTRTETLELKHNGQALIGYEHQGWRGESKGKVSTILEYSEDVTAIEMGWSHGNLIRNLTIIYNGKGKSTKVAILSENKSVGLHLDNIIIRNFYTGVKIGKKDKKNTEGGHHWESIFNNVFVEKHHIGFDFTGSTQVVSMRDATALNGDDSKSNKSKPIGFYLKQGSFSLTNARAENNGTNFLLEGDTVVIADKIHCEGARFLEFDLKGTSYFFANYIKSAHTHHGGTLNALIRIGEPKSHQEYPKMHVNYFYFQSSNKAKIDKDKNILQPSVVKTILDQKSRGKLVINEFENNGYLDDISTQHPPSYIYFLKEGFKLIGNNLQPGKAIAIKDKTDFNASLDFEIKKNNGKTKSLLIENSKQHDGRNEYIYYNKKWRYKDLQKAPTFYQAFHKISTDLDFSNSYGKFAGIEIRNFNEEKEDLTIILSTSKALVGDEIYIKAYNYDNARPLDIKVLLSETVKDRIPFGKVGVYRYIKRRFPGKQKKEYVNKEKATWIKIK